MINRISIKNFKSLRNIDNLEIKPVTILCGTNSCGKSSFLKSLLLLKQTSEFANQREGIIFNGDYVRLGSFKSSVYKNDLQSTIEISLSTQWLFKDLYKPFGSFRALGPTVRTIGDKNNILKKNIEICYTIRIAIDYSQKTAYVPRTYIQNYSVNINTNGSAIANIKIERQGNKSILSANGLRKRRASRRVDSDSLDIIDFSQTIGAVEFNGLIPDSRSLFSVITEDRHNTDYFEDGYYDIYNFISDLNRVWQSIMEELHYIGPLREEPNRRYIYENVIMDIGTKGENAPYLFLNEGMNIIPKQYIPNDSFNDFELVEGKSLSDSVVEWMRLMGIENFRADHENEVIRISMADKRGAIQRSNIADVGFGISQIFPILLEGIRMPEKSILLLEQPEIHLHPGLQAKMADFFISLAKSNKNVIVETHSDHIINRLVRRIVEDPTNEMNSLIQIYFVSPGEQGAVFEKIAIDDSRGIINWPKGFFDTYSEDQDLILRAGLMKRKAMRRQRGDI